MRPPQVGAIPFASHLRSSELYRGAPFRDHVAGSGWETGLAEPCATTLGGVMAGGQGKALSRAILAVRKRQGQSQEKVQAVTGIPQVTLSRWENGAEPSLDDIARLEEGLGVGRGTILREAGYVTEKPTTVGEVIDSDPTLSDDVRALLWATYREAQALSARLSSATSTPTAKGAGRGR